VAAPARRVHGREHERRRVGDAAGGCIADAARPFLDVAGLLPDNYEIPYNEDDQAEFAYRREDDGSPVMPANNARGDGNPHEDGEFVSCASRSNWVRFSC
jgi:hypothetical protein